MWVEAKDAVNHPTAHRTAHSKRVTHPKMSLLLTPRNPASSTGLVTAFPSITMLNPALPRALPYPHYLTMSRRPRGRTRNSFV